MNKIFGGCFFSILIVLFVINFQSKSLSGTKWIKHISKSYGITDSLIFTDSVYYKYVSEIGMMYFGDYKIENDTLRIIERGRYWNYKKYEEQSTRIRYKIYKDSIVYIGVDKLIDNKWLRYDEKNSDFVYYRYRNGN